MLGTYLTRVPLRISGLRGRRALASIPFERNSDGFDFDTQIIIQLVDAGKRIVEVPIPTYYGDEICYVNGLKYARDVSLDVVRYKLGKLGFTSGDLGAVGQEYIMKHSEQSSHEVILRWLERIPRARVLDLGCSGGLLAEEVRRRGHHVTAVDLVELPGVRQRVDRFIQADLDQGLPRQVADEGPFDIVLAADLLEHVRHPGRSSATSAMSSCLGGSLIVSVPNFGHWYARVRVAFGLFDYDQRGILDEGHVRFFTRRGLLRRLRGAGFCVQRHEVTGLPLEVLTRSETLPRRLVRMHRPFRGGRPSDPVRLPVRRAVRECAAAERRSTAVGGVIWGRPSPLSRRFRLAWPRSGTSTR